MYGNYKELSEVDLDKKIEECMSRMAFAHRFSTDQFRALQSALNELKREKQLRQEAKTVDKAKTGTWIDTEKGVEQDEDDGYGDFININ